ncbi:MAG: haloacid dehalogenase type II [Pseudomonadota bacterium]
MSDSTKVLAFDVFGTVVDWCGSVAREVDALSLGIDGGDFARAWRAGYAPAMARVMAGEKPWTLLDDLHRSILNEVLVKFGITQLNDDQIAELNKVWHRLAPWPDAIDGLTRLKSKFIICTLSNGNLGLLTNMAKRAHLPWDCVLSAEVFRAYKPSPKTYLGVALIFDIHPTDVMLVAAHHDDLAAARKCGLRTAYIERKTEFGLGHEKDVSPRPENDFHAKDFIELAGQLGC